MSHHIETKKEAQRKKNRKVWELFLNFGRLNENVDIGAPASKEKLSVKGEKRVSHGATAPKVALIRNRLDNSRRQADERWNRFAGTSDGGGRGR